MSKKDENYYIIETDLAIVPFNTTIIAYYGNIPAQVGEPRAKFYFNHKSQISQTSQPGDILLTSIKPILSDFEYRILDPIKKLSYQEIFDLVSKEPDKYIIKSWDLPIELIKNLVYPNSSAYERISELKNKEYINPNKDQFFDFCMNKLTSQRELLDNMIKSDDLESITKIFIKQSDVIEEITGESYLKILKKASDASKNFQEYLTNVYKCFEEYLTELVKEKDVDIDLILLKNSPWAGYVDKFRQVQIDELENIEIVQTKRGYNLEDFTKTILGRKILKGLGFNTRKKYYDETEMREINNFAKKINVKLNLLK